jgi:tetratricopeptide (TPR) repeat protein
LVKDAPGLDQLFEDLFRDYTPDELAVIKAKYATEGDVLEAEGNFQGALESFQEAARLPGANFCRDCVYFNLGRLFDQMNQPDSALAAYQRAVNAKGLGSNTGRDLAPTLRRMGELYEARGEREKAKDYYSRFVALWRDADSDLQPAVQDVKARLAQLAAEPRP